MQDFQHKISSFGARTSFKSKICCYRLQGTCAPYNGTVCKQVLGNEVILLNASYGNPGLEQDSQVNELMQGVLSSMVRKPNCQAAALKVFCRHVFPGCTEETGKAKPIHLCKYVFSQLYPPDLFVIALLSMRLVSFPADDPIFYFLE